jgi:hypothetical protein
LEVECLDRLYSYIGPLAPSDTGDLYARAVGKPIPSPVVLWQVTEGFREAVKSLAQREQIPIYQFTHQER